MSESFTVSGDFEDYLQHFNMAAKLSGWYFSGHDKRSQHFALRLTENALRFYTSFSHKMQNDYEFFVDDFNQNYRTNVDILKARLKAAKEQLGKDLAIFLCDIRHLARLSYRAHPRLTDQIVLSSFIQGLKNFTLRWEIEKLKPTTSDEALALANHLDHCLALDYQSNAPQCRPMTSSVKHVAASISKTDTVDELVQSLHNGNNFFAVLEQPENRFCGKCPPTVTLQ